MLTSKGPRDRLIPTLPRPAYVVLVGDALSALGQGMSLPYLLVYLNQVQGINMATAGFVLSTVALAAFAGSPLGGWFSDLVGPRRVLLASLMCSAVGIAMFAGVTQPPMAFLAAAVLGLGTSVEVPALDALLAGLVRPAQRSAVFAIRHATLNGGLAIGALTAGFIVDTARPSTFQAVYFVDAATFLAFIPLLLLIPARLQTAAPEASAKPSFRIVVSDRLFISVVGLSALLVTIGLAQYHAAFPGWAAREGGISPDALGACFAANAATVVLLQLPVLRILRGRKRTTAIAVACVGWALTWLLAWIFGYAGGGWIAQLGFIATMVAFGVAETALTPTLPAIVNDLAPEHLRGRYNGVSALGWTTGFFLGPAFAGVALGAGMGPLLLALLAAGCLWGVFWAMRLGNRLPAYANRIG